MSKIRSKVSTPEVSRTSEPRQLLGDGSGPQCGPEGTASARGTPPSTQAQKDLRKEAGRHVNHRYRQGVGVRGVTYSFLFTLKMEKMRMTQFLSWPGLIT